MGMDAPHLGQPMEPVLGRVADGFAEIAMHAGCRGTRAKSRFLNRPATLMKEPQGGREMNLLPSIPTDYLAAGVVALFKRRARRLFLRLAVREWTMPVLAALS